MIIDVHYLTETVTVRYRVSGMRVIELEFNHRAMLDIPVMLRTVTAVRNDVSRVLLLT